jgi:hypothetical protein
LQRRGDLICQSLLLVSLAKLAFESLIFRHLLRKQTTPLKRSALLMTGPLVRWTRARFACGLLGGFVLPLVLRSLLDDVVPASPAMIATSAGLFVLCVLGELLERYLFFAAVAAPRMPGTIR